MDCDRISEFPDSLLTQILSYLPTKDSVKTSVLSKRWEFLWLKVSGLDLNANYFLPYGEALSSFMDRFLELNRESRLHKFKIKYNRYTNTMNQDCKRSLVEEWITQMFHHRGGVQHLDIEKETCRDLDILPKSVYVSKTLVSLKLVRVGIIEEDTNLDDLVVSLPCLKILHLEDTYTVLKRYGFFIMDYITDANLSIMEKLISGSPVLENITMEYSMSPWPGQVSSFWTSVPQCLSSTLEYVTIYKQIMKKETGIKLVNFFLENSAVLKKLTLSCTHSHDTTTNQDAESYKKLLTSTKLSPRCQVFVC